MPRNATPSSASVLFLSAASRRTRLTAGRSPARPRAGRAYFCTKSRTRRPDTSTFLPMSFLRAESNSSRAHGRIDTRVTLVGPPARRAREAPAEPPAAIAPHSKAGRAPPPIRHSLSHVFTKRRLHPSTCFPRPLLQARLLAIHIAETYSATANAKKTKRHPSWTTRARAREPPSIAAASNARIPCSSLPYPLPPLQPKLDRARA